MFSCEVEPVERRQDLADGPVELRDRVAARPHRRRAGEARVRHARHVGVVRREEQEERLAAMLLDERGRLAGEDVRHVLVLPERRLAAGHVADPADAVDDRLVVPVARMDLEQIRVAPARRLVADGWP